MTRPAADALADCRCGGRAIIRKTEEIEQSRACCVACPASTAWYLSCSEAIAAWNRRATPVGESHKAAAEEIHAQMLKLGIGCGDGAPCKLAKGCGCSVEIARALKRPIPPAAEETGNG